MKPLRVLHVTAPCEVGGLERVVHALSAGLVSRGHDVHVAAVLDAQLPTPPFLGELARAGARVHPIRLRPRAYLRERAELRRLCQLIVPDVVHTHSDRPDVVDAPVARQLGIPTVTTLHGASNMGGKGAVYEWLQNRAARQFDAVVAVADPIVGVLARHGVRRERIHVIPNAWHPFREPLERSAARGALGLPNDQVVIGWVGRLVAVKAPEVFVEALALLQSAGWRAVIVGDGPMRATVQALARAHRLDNVSFVGAVENAAIYYSAFDVFALSSHSEGTPITILEAMAGRVPIVATGVGGVPAMLENTDAALVPAADPLALAAAIDNVIARRHERQLLTERAAKRLADDYSVGPWIQAYERVYQRLTPNGPRNDSHTLNRRESSPSMAL